MKIQFNIQFLIPTKLNVDSIFGMSTPNHTFLLVLKIESISQKVGGNN